MRSLVGLLFWGLYSSIALAQSEPSLPEGLFPASPTQLAEPELPSGFSLPDLKGRQSSEQHSNWGEIKGFAEMRSGWRSRDPIDQNRGTVREARLQLDWSIALGDVEAHLVTDLLYDDLASTQANDIESGQGWLDLREASLLVRPLPWADVNLGRQVLTWGTGDLLFINDLFPKDWKSFFIGRDESYLKAPSDALKGSFFTQLLNIDIVYTPRFDSDRYIDGERLSYFQPLVGELVGAHNRLTVTSRGEWIGEDELALRLHRLINSAEVALYGYRGYWKLPLGIKLDSGRGYFPELDVWGASLRAPFLTGIGSVEFGYYDSKESDSGKNAAVRNSEWRFMAGYERELRKNLTAGLQFYLEQMDDYSAYLINLIPGSVVRDERRRVITVRLTQLLMNQNLTLSFFGFYGETDDDYHVRIRANYRVSDNWMVEAGGNEFQGEEVSSFFGQFESNANLYLGVRYSF